MKKSFIIYIGILILILILIGYVMSDSFKLKIEKKSKVIDISSKKIISELDSEDDSDITGSTQDRFPSELLPLDPPANAQRYKISEGVVSYSTDVKFSQKPKIVVRGELTSLKGYGWYDIATKSGALFIEFDVGDFSSDSISRDKEVMKFFVDSQVQISGVLGNILLSPEKNNKQNVKLKMNVNGVVKEVEFKIEAQLKNGDIIATGVTDLKLSEIGIALPVLKKGDVMPTTTRLEFKIKAVPFE